MAQVPSGSRGPTRPTRIRMHGLQRSKKPNISKLIEEIQKKGHILRIEAPMGIVGLPGSGRKTLAYRLDKTHLRRAFADGEVPTAYCYTAFFPGRFPRYFHGPYQRYSLTLYVYIIEEPAELPPRFPPRYWEHWHDFCCLLFTFDVRNAMTFHSVSMKLTGYRRTLDFIAACLMVGNKIDRRNEVPSETSQELSERTIHMEAEHLGISYFECSAKNNWGVGPLLRRIECYATDRRYWLPDDS